MPGLEDCKAIKLLSFDDGPDGYLSIGNSLGQIPFEIRRFYTITRLSQNAIRGRHAHKQLQQAIFCVRGSAELFLDDGKKTKTLRLESPDRGIYLPPGIWHEVSDFRNEALILVLASALFNESDYIRDYEEFLRHVQTGPCSLS